MGDDFPREGYWSSRQWSAREPKIFNALFNHGGVFRFCISLVFQTTLQLGVFKIQQFGNGRRLPEGRLLELKARDSKIFNALSNHGGVFRFCISLAFITTLQLVVLKIHQFGNGRRPAARRLLGFRPMVRKGPQNFQCFVQSLPNFRFWISLAFQTTFQLGVFEIHLFWQWEMTSLWKAIGAQGNGRLVIPKFSLC